MPREHGFTLIDLMVTLAVAAILVTVAVPGLTGLVAEQRVITTTNRFVTALHLTRSEAVRRGTRVTLCASTDGQTCSSPDDFSGGWLVREGPAPGGSLVDGAGEVIRVFSGHPSLTVIGNQGVPGYISYLGTGETRRLSGALQMGTVEICGGERARRVIISSTGRPRVETAGC
ncbi:GspH/FimT family pseudopilin [Thioalkalivibrio thiocyanodenitrificans]|uniref:GspH/FimT family pseudopilin n=1 Tax=Thioalkalivibrio thiocyanodenitrificans TaxID=243063 RepID=UPI000378B568|nr:GspH/FimT family pseudopilin [Thioalkalivibrio thiocyanodenitrificans]